MKKGMLARRWIRLLVSLVVVVSLLSGIGPAFAQDKPEDIVTVAAVNFHAIWGDKAKNLEKIKDDIIKAAKQGANIILFPETALTGYDIDEKVMMHKENAETIPGPSTNEIAKLTRKYGVYVVVGMPERDSEDPDIIYNAAAVIGPDGVIGSYRKIHPALDEPKWATKGEEPLAFDTPWGLVGVGICYDTYEFPELVRYYAALGARLYLNVTATITFSDVMECRYINQLQARVYENRIFIASANLVGKGLTTEWPGGSGILGPRENNTHVKWYDGPSRGKEEIEIATIDLSKADRKIYNINPLTGTPDWRLNIYKKMLEDIDNKTELGEYK